MNELRPGSALREAPPVFDRAEAALPPEAQTILVTGAAGFISLLLCATAPRERVHLEAFNIASDAPITLNALFRLIAEIGGVPPLVSGAGSGLIRYARVGCAPRGPLVGRNVVRWKGRTRGPLRAMLEDGAWRRGDTE